MIDYLIREGWLKTPKIIKAFQKIKRIDFLPEEIKHLAELDEPLPIGYGQTNSQPMVVAFMIEKLDPKPGHKILDIGSGSGWTTALLSHIVGKNGKVIASEIIPELMEFGKNNVSKYSFVKKGIAEFYCADGSKSHPYPQKFDRILTSAAANEIPQPWKDQLKIGGKIVAPVNSSIFILTKETGREFKSIEYEGFTFVPLISK